MGCAIDLRATGFDGAIFGRSVLHVHIESTWLCRGRVDAAHVAEALRDSLQLRTASIMAWIVPAGALDKAESRSICRAIRSLDNKGPRN